MSSDSPASILFNTDGYAVGALRDGEFIPIDNAGLLFGGQDSSGNFRYLSVNDSGILRVNTSLRNNIVGKYFIGSDLIAGEALQQNLLTIENPADSEKTIFITRIVMNGVVDTMSSVIFSYSAGRTIGLPSGGTTILPDKQDSSFPDSAAIIRVLPTDVTDGYGNLWTSSPGVFLSDGSYRPNILDTLLAREEDQDIILRPGECLLFKAGINSSNWFHWINLVWTEADES